jgi:hypothetical protein
MKLSYHIGYVFLILLLISFSRATSGQEWTEPVNISNIGSLISVDLNFVADHKNVTHVVWDQRITDTYWKIIYSKSEDDANTWSEPIELLGNTNYWMAQPHIACDSKNNIYVVYTHDYLGWTAEGRLIKMITWNGHEWNEPIIISEGLPGSHYPKILLDKYDNLFALWGVGDDKMYYRYYKNNQWSDIFCPYCDSADWFYFSDGINIANSTMHLSGSSLSYNYYGERPQYYMFDMLNNVWQNPEMISKDTMVVDIDIVVNKSGIPETVYRKITTNSFGISFNRTMYAKKKCVNWCIPELVSGVDVNQKYQQIEVDQLNHVHIVEQQNLDLGQLLVHNSKQYENWIGQVIDSSAYLVNPKLLFNNNKLYCVYSKSWEEGNQLLSDIFISKYDIITGQSQPASITKNIPEINVFPNPGIKNFTITFDNGRQQHINLSVFDINGKYIKTLCNKTMPPEKQKVQWNGTDKNGKEVQSGSYLVRLKMGSKTATQIVEIIK